MHEESLKSYSQKDLSNLLERGVHIPDLNLVHITRDVQLENIAPVSYTHLTLPTNREV